MKTRSLEEYDRMIIEVRQFTDTAMTERNVGSIAVGELFERVEEADYPLVRHAVQVLSTSDFKLRPQLHGSGARFMLEA